MTQPMSAAVQKMSVSALRSKLAQCVYARADQVAAGGVQDALGLTRAARGVHDVERVLGREELAFVLVGLAAEQLVPPVVPSLGHRRVLPGALDHQDVAYVGATLECLVDRGLEGGGGAAPEAAVGGDHHLDPAVQDPGGQCVGGEAAEDHGVRSPKTGAGQHGDHGLGNHRQVDRDPVAGLHPELGQCVRRPFDLVGQLGVRDRPGVARLALEVERHPVTEPGLDVPVQAVVRGVEGAIGEPGGERRLAPVQHLARLGVPADPLGLLRPEALEVLRGALVGLGCDVGIGSKLSWWRKPSILVQQVLQSLITHAVRLSSR